MTGLLIEGRPLMNHGDVARLFHAIDALPAGTGHLTLTVTATFEKKAVLTPELLEAMKNDLRQSLEIAMERIDYDVICELYDAEKVR